MKSPKLTFDYYNQLQLVQDPQGARQGMGDLPDQEALLKELNISGNNPTHNYIYDAIGQLVEDRTEGLVIDWRVDGKVASISKGHHTTTTNDDVVIQFHYDGLGNRISKETLKAGEATQQTYYTRDAQGNVMAVYGEGGTTTVVRDTPAELTVGEVADTETDIYARNHITSTTTIADKQTLNFTAGQSITLSPGFEAKQGSNATLKIGDVPATTSKEGEEVAGVFLKEHHIYGSSRLGILAHDKLIIAENPKATNEPTGKKNYELTNHLGNVLSVISDERNGNKPDVIAFNDYYPFGMLLPNRHGSSDKYRYGFNGMEKDDELKGLGNSYDFGARMYDNRIGKFLSLDPMEMKFPNESPYSYVGGNPLLYNDLDGKFKIPFHLEITNYALGKAGLKLSWSSKLDIQNGNSIVADVLGAASDYHFDARRDFDEIQSTWKGLNEQINDLKNEFGPVNEVVGGIDAIKLGRTLHTVQDFYAHSNYVELYIQYYQDKNDGEIPDAVDIPIYEEGLLNQDFADNYLKENLKTGQFHLHRYLIGKDVEKTHEEGDTHHDDIAKDNPKMGKIIKGKNGTVNTFDAAKEVAKKHSTQVIEKVVNKKK